MLKHSPNTSEPHLKRVYLSDNGNYLCWKSPNKDDQKLFPLSSILKVTSKFKGSLKESERAECRVVVVSTERNL